MSVNEYLIIEDYTGTYTERMPTTYPFPPLTLFEHFLQTLRLC